MKTFRYIRPTKRWTRAQQERATDQDGIHFDVVDGDQGRTFGTLIKLLKPGNAVLVESLQVFARRRDTICERIRRIFAKDCTIIDADGNTFEPRQANVICAAVMTGGYVIKEPIEREAHNKTPDDVMERAREMWTGDAFAGMTNKQISEVVGVSTVTLTARLGKRGRKPGRPRKR